MNLIHCSSDCLYQRDGYCELDNAAEITNCKKTGGCLHYLPKRSGDGRKPAPSGNTNLR